MNFTREPIIETIITPKEGFKLILRNSNGNSQEEYSVSSVEVVSFGKSFFFRSLEKPKAFLLPVSDYEVLEAREMRAILKKPQVEKTIKIGGGKVTKNKEALEDEEEAPQDLKKKSRRKKGKQQRQAPEEQKVKKEVETPLPPQQPVEKEMVASPRRTLLPPPTSLISEQISRYKEFLASEGALLPEELAEGDKVEEMPHEDHGDLSFLPQDEVISPEPSLYEEESYHDKVVEFEEEAPTSHDKEE